MSITNTLQRAINVAQQFIRNSPLTGVGNVINEPAFSNGDWVRQFILSPPFAWRWNRANTGFITTAGVQDYVLTNWFSQTFVAVGSIFIDSRGNQQQVTVAGITGLTQPAWSAIVGNLTADGAATWKNIGPTGLGSNPLNNFGWLERAGITTTQGVTTEIEVSLALGQESQQNQPTRMSAQYDPGDGTLRVRILPAPDQVYLVTFDFQQAAPSFASTGDTWAPIPDYLWYLIIQGFTAKAYEYLDNSRFQTNIILFMRQVIAANSGLSESQVNIFLGRFLDTERQTRAALSGVQAGLQGRGLFGA